MDKIGKITIFSAIILLSIFLAIIFYDLFPSITAVTESSTVSNATVAVSIGFTFSDNLTAGVLFGSVNQNTNDNNASSNYNHNWSGVTGCTNSNCTAYWIDMDSGNNADSDTCIKDNAALTSGGYTIPNTGYTYDANQTANGANMNSPAGSTAITTSYVSFGDTNLSASENQTIQFYLDVPNGQQAGTYNNSVYFKIVQSGTSC